MNNIITKIKTNIGRLSNHGGVFAETVMKVGLVVIVGGLVLIVLKTAIPDLFTKLITKIKTTLDIASCILPKS